MSNINLPCLEMTRPQFDQIPRAEELGDSGFLKYIPIGTMFRCKGTGSRIEDAVIGHLVPGGDAFCDQIGAALLSLPERFVNRYRIKIVDEYCI